MDNFKLNLIECNDALILQRMKMKEVQTVGSLPRMNFQCNLYQEESFKEGNILDSTLSFFNPIKYHIMQEIWHSRHFHEIIIY